jgi:hypothetical protein
MPYGIPPGYRSPVSSSQGDNANLLIHSMWWANKVLDEHDEERTSAGLVSVKPTNRRQSCP